MTTIFIQMNDKFFSLKFCASIRDYVLNSHTKCQTRSRQIKPRPASPNGHVKHPSSEILHSDEK